MSKLVDKERLAQLAKALDERMKAAVAAEKDRAMGEEARIEGKVDGNAAAIAAINNENTGILKQAKDYADGKVATEKERAEGVEQGLAGRIETLEGKFTGGEDSVASQIEAAVNVEKQRALGQEAAIRSEFKAVDDTIKSDMATMKLELQGEIDADVKVVADELAKQKDSNIAGTLANGVSQAFEALQDHQGRLNNHDATLANYESKFVIINGEGVGSIKYAVKEEADRAKAEEERIAGLVGTEQERAEAKEGELAQSIAGEKSRAEGKEGELLAAINKEVQDRGQADQELSNRLTAVEGILNPAEGEMGFEEVVAKLDELEKEDADIRADFAAADAALQESMESVLEEFSGMVSESLNELGDAVGELQEADKTFQTELDKKLAIADYNPKMEELEAEDEAIRAAFAKADADLHTTISAEIDADVKAAVDAQKVKDDAQDESLEDHKGRIEALEARFGDGTGTVESQIAKVQKEVDDLEGVVGGIDTVVKDHTTKLTGLKKPDGTEAATVQIAINAAKDAAIAKAVELDFDMNERMSLVEGKLNTGGAIESRIAKNESDIAGHKVLIDKFNGNAQTAGSIAEAKAVADDAKAKIDAFMDANAVKDDTINTLKEIQSYIAEHGTEAAGMVDDIAKNAADIAAEASRAAGEEAKIRQELADEAAEIRGEVETALGKWSVIEEGGAVSVERSGLRGEVETYFDNFGQELADLLEAIQQDYADKDAALKSQLQAEIDADVKVVADALEHEKDAYAEGTFANSIAEEMLRAMGQENAITQQLIDNNKDRIAEEVRIEGLITTEVDRATKAEAALGTRITEVKDACEEMDRLRQASIEGLERFEEETTALLGKKAGVNAFGQPTDATGLCKDVADNKDAIEKEVTDRQTAITNALKAYSTTEDMKQVIGNVVNSLALTMENDQVVLKLGGVDGIALTSVSLNMATDADIDAIIAGLDEE